MQKLDRNCDLENILTVLDFGMVIVDNDLKVKSFSQKAKEIFNISEHNMHELITTIDTKVDLGNIKKLIEDVMRDKEKNIFEKQHGDIYYKISIYPYVDSDSKEPKYNGAILTFMDITHIKQSELKLLESKKEVQTEKDRVTKILDEQENITIVTDGIALKSVNKQFLRVLGYKDLETYTKKHKCICDLFNEKKNAKHLRAEMNGLVWLEHINQHVDEVHEVYFDDKDGVEHIYVVKASKKIFQDVQVITFTDISKLREHENMLQQQCKMASMGEMIGNIAHQWRQPLNALSASVFLLSSKYDDNEFEKKDMEAFTDRANTIIQKMSTTINDFKNFFSSDKAKVRFEISQAVDECVSFVKDSYLSNNIELIIHHDENLVLKGFRNELMQVLLILLNNAKDALVENKVKNSEVKIVSKIKDNIITISIQDNGGGIKEEVVNKVFEPYFTTKFQSNGTGIGLYMAKMIIEESMGGKLTLENKKDGALATIKCEV